MLLWLLLLWHASEQLDRSCCCCNHSIKTNRTQRTNHSKDAKASTSHKQSVYCTDRTCVYLCVSVCVHSTGFSQIPSFNLNDVQTTITTTTTMMATSTSMSGQRFWGFTSITTASAATSPSTATSTSNSTTIDRLYATVVAAIQLALSLSSRASLIQCGTQKTSSQKNKTKKIYKTIRQIHFESPKNFGTLVAISDDLSDAFIN